MFAFFLLVYKFETFRSVSIHHLAALVQKELQNLNKKNWDTLMINVDFFGLELEALFLNLVYFHGEDFRVNRSLVKHCLTKLKKNGSRWLSFSTYYYFFLSFLLSCHVLKVKNRRNKLPSNIFAELCCAKYLFEG